MTSHRPKRKRSASEHSMLEERVVKEQRLTAENKREDQDFWTGKHPTIMLTAGICKLRDLRLLATDGSLIDEFLNTIQVLADCKDTDGYLLPTFVVRSLDNGCSEAI
ncbi:hypothetical protein LTS09_018069 [Friedmanniomyces endolithicus]|nr:hypothetical protein LTS09_018069 [Friedmanniomyces endolithicus]